LIMKNTMGLSGGKGGAGDEKVPKRVNDSRTTPESPKGKSQGTLVSKKKSYVKRQKGKKPQESLQGGGRILQTEFKNQKGNPTKKRRTD